MMHLTAFKIVVNLLDFQSGKELGACPVVNSWKIPQDGTLLKSPHIIREILFSGNCKQKSKGIPVMKNL